MRLSTKDIKSEIIERGNYKRFYRTLTDDELLIVKKQLIDALKVFDEICRKNSLTYMVLAGALIGAVRDGQALPWDDDIDIVMPRPDYEKFGDIFKNCKFGDSYTFMYPQDNEVITCGAHFYKKDSNLSSLISDEIGSSNIYESYAYLDILPMDSCLNNKLLDKVKGTLSNLLHQGYICRRCFKSNDPFVNYLAKDSHELKMNLFVRKAFACLFLPISRKDFFRILRALNKYNGNSQYLTIPLGAKRYFGEKMLREVWFPVKDMNFEGLQIMVPNKPEEYLEHRYGDYLTVPNEQEQAIIKQRLRHDWQSLI